MSYIIIESNITCNIYIEKHYATNISVIDKQRLYTQLKHQLGAPIVGVELEDDMLDSLLEIAIQDYALCMLTTG